MLKLFAAFAFCLAARVGSVFGIEGPPFVPDPSFSKVFADTTLEFSSPGEVAFFDTHLSYQGGEADRLREMFEYWGRQEFESYFDRYFEERFGALEKASPLEVNDDLAKNILEIRIKYLLHDLWNPDSEKDQNYYFNLFPVHIAEVLDFNVDPLRQMPLSLDHPTHLSESITLVNLEDEWDEVEVEKSFDTEEVAFRYEEKSEGNRLRYRYEFQTKKDNVPLHHLEEYSKLLLEIEELFFISISISMNPFDIYGELFKDDNYLLLGGVTICYGWIIFMLSRKKKNLGDNL